MAPTPSNNNTNVRPCSMAKDLDQLGFGYGPCKKGYKNRPDPLDRGRPGSKRVVHIMPRPTRHHLLESEREAVQFHRPTGRGREPSSRCQRGGSILGQ